MAYTVKVRVTWDHAKNLANQRKHGIAFEEARVLFRSEREGDVVRIISARWATPSEQALFRSHIRRLT